MGRVGGLILMAVSLIVLGLIVRSDLVALAVAAIGFVFIAAGVVSGVAGVALLHARGTGWASDR